MGRFMVLELAPLLKLNVGLKDIHLNETNTGWEIDCFAGRIKDAVEIAKC